MIFKSAFIMCKLINCDNLTGFNLIVSALKKNHLVALPTDTIYGFSIALSAPVHKLATIKNRSATTKPFLLLIKDWEQAQKIVNWTDEMKTQINAYWPGPFTFILPKHPQFRHPYFDQFQEIAVRMPASAFLNHLMSFTGALISTSCNKTNQTALNDPLQIQQEFKNYSTLLIAYGQINAQMLNHPSTIYRWSKNAIIKVR